jgi:hypothetical protein
MVTMPEVVMRQRFCCAEECGEVLTICRSCDRGQRYCSETCQERSRLDQRRESNRRHQASPESRLDHRDRQRAYRQRSQESVTDQGSEECSGSVTVSLVVSSDESRTFWRVTKVFEYPLRCRVCGRRSRWLEMESW